MKPGSRPAANKIVVNALNPKHIATELPSGMACDFDPSAVLLKPLVAHLATGSPDGPRESPVWFLWEEQAIWLIGNSQDSFPKRLRAESRCAVGMVDFDVERGILRHTGIRGVAEIRAMDQARLGRFLERYLGPDRDAWNPWFIEHIADPLDLMIRITPQSIVAKDVSFFKTGPALATT
jgi:hypothetical protein